MKTGALFYRHVFINFKSIVLIFVFHFLCFDWQTTGDHYMILNITLVSILWKHFAQNKKYTCSGISWKLVIHCDTEVQKQLSLLLIKTTGFQGRMVPECYFYNNISIFLMHHNPLLFIVGQLCIALLAEIYQILKFKNRKEWPILVKLILMKFCLKFK